jgi:hypothetical protein
MNMEVEDMELLHNFVANESKPAFRALVNRHVDMVLPPHCGKPVMLIWRKSPRRLHV